MVEKSNKSPSSFYSSTTIEHSSPNSNQFWENSESSPIPSQVPTGSHSGMVFENGTIPQVEQFDNSLPLHYNNE